MGDPEYASSQFWLLAVLAQAGGNYDDALRLYRASLAGLQRYPFEWISCLFNLATMASALLRHELSARLLGAMALKEERNRRLSPSEHEQINRLADAVQAHLGEACFAAERARGQEQDFDQTFEEAISILEAALAVQDQGASVQ
jgi:tetratricopeptide (TPR) repeat protein